MAEVKISILQKSGGVCVCVPLCLCLQIGGRFFYLYFIHWSQLDYYILYKVLLTISTHEHLVKKKHLHDMT